MKHDTHVLPLRVWLTWGAGILAVLAVTITGWLSWRNSQTAIDDLADQLQRRASAQVQERLVAYLDSPPRVVELMVNAVETGVVDLDDPASIYRYLWRLAKVFDGITYLNYGLEDGHFHGLGRVSPDQPELHIEETNPADISVLYRYPLDPQGHRLNHHSELPFGNFHEQVWYAQPLSAEGLIWTDIYNWEDDRALSVIGAGQALRDATGRLIGVAGVDLMLGEISRFLAGLRLSEHARIFILDRHGLLVATSIGQVYRPGPRGAERIAAMAAEDEAIRAAAKRLQEQHGGFSGIHEAISDHLDWGDGRWMLQVTPWQDPHGLDWLILVTLPERDFAETIARNNRTTLVVVGLIMVCILLVALVGGRLVSRPILELDEAARRVAEGDLSAKVGMTAFRELNQLAESFNSMILQLRDAFNRAEQAQSHLEEQVATRTAELQRANLELQELSRRDALTQLPNRRHFDEVLASEWDRARRASLSLSLIMLDVDYFKRFNDHYGHQAGDACLQAVAPILAERVRRPGDLAARYGGEEFAMILTDADTQGALGVAEAVRRAIAELAIPHAESPLGMVTASLGVATAIPDDGDVAAMLLHGADAALYLAKASGRNRVELSSVGSADQQPSSIRLVWKAGHACGEPTIDSEHRELFQLANALLDLASSEVPLATLEGPLDHLLSSIIEHFAHEERILQQHGYAELDQHAELHRSLIARAQTLRAQLASGDIGFSDLVEFIVVEVVARHMLQADRAFYALFAPH